jgi:hypothetical protein
MVSIRCEHCRKSKVYYWFRSWRPDTRFELNSVTDIKVFYIPEEWEQVKSFLKISSRTWYLLMLYMMLPVYTQKCNSDMFLCWIGQLFLLSVGISLLVVQTLKCKSLGIYEFSFRNYVLHVLSIYMSSDMFSIRSFTMNSKCDYI